MSSTDICLHLAQARRDRERCSAEELAFETTAAAIAAMQPVSRIAMLSTMIAESVIEIGQGDERRVEAALEASVEQIGRAARAFFLDDRQASMIAD